MCAEASEDMLFMHGLHLRNPHLYTYTCPNSPTRAQTTMKATAVGSSSRCVLVVRTCVKAVLQTRISFVNTCACISHLSNAPKPGKFSASRGNIKFVKE